MYEFVTLPQTLSLRAKDPLRKSLCPFTHLHTRGNILGASKGVERDKQPAKRDLISVKRDLHLVKNAHLDKRALHPLKRALHPWTHLHSRVGKMVSAQ